MMSDIKHRILHCCWTVFVINDKANITFFQFL